MKLFWGQGLRIWFLRVCLPAAMKCPPHSHYEQCSTGCPLTCGDLPVPGGCGQDCHEACECDEGYMLSGDFCVPRNECGCVYQGAYYPPGHTFYPGSNCASLCRCQQDGVVSCQEAGCGPHEACRPTNGALGCVSVGSVTCQASGDPHYTTFDGRRFDFMGACLYVLARTCRTRPGLPHVPSLPEFTVLQENVHWNGNRVSVTKAITVVVGNYTLRLQQKLWKVTVSAGVGRDVAFKAKAVAPNGLGSGVRAWLPGVVSGEGRRLWSEVLEPGLHH